MKKPFFSVIMPAYNGMKFINQAVDSVLGQTCQDFELLIVDDCSTDETVTHLCQQYQLQKQQTVYQNETAQLRLIALECNGGIGNARNTAMQAASGAYLVFIDQDDELRADALETIYRKYTAEAGSGEITGPGEITDSYVADVYAYGYTRIDEAGKPLMELPLEVEQGVDLRWDLCTVWTYALRRDFVMEHQLQFPVDAMNEDMIFSMQVARFTDRIVLLHECLYAHRVNEQSTSNRMSERFDRYPLSRELVYRTALENYQYVRTAQDRQMVWLAMLAYHYSIWFGIFRKVPKEVKLKEYRLHRALLEQYFGDYLHHYRVPLFQPKCRRFIYRLVVWVSYRMEKWFGQRFYEWFIVKMGNNYPR